MDSEVYGKEYFEGIYARLKKEKESVLRAFLSLLLQEKKEIERILDLGCGEGEFLKICEDRELETVGIDVSSYALSEAQKKTKGKLLKLDLEKKQIPFPDDTFETVTCFDLVEHLRRVDLLFKEVKRVLKNGGVFFITTPNGDYLPKDFLGHFVMKDPTHVNLQGERYWLDKLKKAGFSKIKTKGCLLFGFPPSMGLRYFLKKLKIPVLIRPIFFPIRSLTSELFIFARK